jgi:hypothetical protein
MELRGKGMLRRVFVNLSLWTAMLYASGLSAVPSALHASAPDTCPSAAALPVNRFTEDMRTKNIDDVLSLYTHDAIFAQPDGAQVKGKNRLRNLYLHVFATYEARFYGHPHRAAVCVFNPAPMRRIFVFGVMGPANTFAASTNSGTRRGKMVSGLSCA